jgi:hypothetical protein
MVKIRKRSINTQVLRKAPKAAKYMLDGLPPAVALAGADLAVFQDHCNIAKAILFASIDEQMHACIIENQGDADLCYITVNVNVLFKPIWDKAIEKTAQEKLNFRAMLMNKFPSFHAAPGERLVQTKFRMTTLALDYETYLGAPLHKPTCLLQESKNLFQTQTITNPRQRR